MEEDPSFSRRPGDGGSGEPSARSSYASDLSFQRSHLRQTYHGESVHLALDVNTYILIKEPESIHF